MFLVALLLSLFGPVSVTVWVLCTILCVILGHTIEHYGAKYIRANGATYTGPDWFTSIIIYGVILGPFSVLMLIPVIIDCMDSNIKTF